MSTQILSLCNHKGGVGKTTSAVNIAAGLARCGRRVLLVDIDPQANTTQAVGLNPYTIEKTVYGVLRDKYTAGETRQTIAVPDDCKGIFHVIPSCLDLVAAETQLVNEYNREHLLSEHLSPIASEYDYILIDCPPSLGMLTTNALTASNALLLPIQPHFFAVQGLQQLLDVVAKVRRGLNKELTIGGVFLTDYNPRVKMHVDAGAAVQQAFPSEMFKTYIRHNVALSECSARGVSIFDYDPKSNGAQDYAALVKELIKRRFADKQTIVVDGKIGKIKNITIK